ncbi:MAG: type IV pilus assembly protein PilM [Deltaproteobacteria bacterium]|nr:MAG: type IV pilus assembly protein PilM [Deltaproteobacteria bacterium]
MILGKKDSLIGLDIGSRSVKVAEITETKNGRKLRRFGMADIPPGAIEDGAISDTETVAQVIRQLLKSANIKATNVALSIGGYSVIIKKINVQTMPEEQLQETIHFEAEQYIPFDISDVNLDFQLLGEVENNPSQMSVFLVAAKKEMVNDYINLATLVGLTPCIVDVEAFALQNIFEANYDIQGENVALIDIGASKTSLNILKDNSSVFMRDVALGCIQINQKIMSMLDCSYDQAELIKFGEPSTKLSADELKQIISAVVTDWCTEIRRALDFFYTNYPDDPIKRIILSGGGANIAEFRQLLAAESAAQVETLNPFSGVVVDEKSFDPEYIRQIGPQAAIAMGLALRRVDDK